MAESNLSGPLAGVRVIEMSAIGPVPHCGLVLAEMGAEVVRLDRAGISDLGVPVPPRFDALARGKRSIVLDLKADEGRQAALRLIAAQDVLIEGFRPGVMERLGLGPEACLAANPRLVYGRISGWGDAGPMAAEAGHDLNFLGLTGALLAMGTPGQPPPVPLNLVADYGGAAMQLTSGVLAALLHARSTGQGQVVATSVFEGAAALTPFAQGLRAAGVWTDQRGGNLLDGGAPFYRTYATLDGGYVAVAAIETRFYQVLLEGLRLAGAIQAAAQMDRAGWPATAALFTARFAERTRDDWAAHFAGTDACVSAVLGWTEASAHPQAAALGLFRTVDEVTLPRTAARFSVTPAGIPAPAVAPGADTQALLREAALPTPLEPP